MSSVVYNELNVLIQRGLSLKGACETMGVARASYYRYLKRLEDKREPLKRGRQSLVSCLTEKVLKVSKLYPTEGYRLIWARLIRDDCEVSASWVYRTMKENDLLLPRGETRIFRGFRKLGQKPPDPPFPNYRWQMDVKEFRIGKSKVFLVNIIDCYSRYVLASYITFNPTSTEATEKGPG